ncbi:hypothetical protein MMPV_004437 [Pyropia vietnamensis]
MAFVAGATLPVAASARRAATTVMATPPPASAPLSRRAALSAGFAAAAAAALAGVSPASAATQTMPKLDKLSDLKKQVEAIDYEEEFVDVGPDSQEKEISNLKKKAKDPAYRAKLKAVIDAEEKKYDEMLAKEKAEEAIIKAKFSKN